MKNQTKAILASTMILALALSSVAGVTYSWFSDEGSSTIQVNTAQIDVDVSTRVYQYGDNINSVTLQKDRDNIHWITAELSVKVTNNSDIPVIIKDLHPEVTREYYTESNVIIHVNPLEDRNFNGIYSEIRTEKKISMTWDDTVNPSSNDWTLSTRHGTYEMHSTTIEVYSYAGTGSDFELSPGECKSFRLKISATDDFMGISFPLSISYSAIQANYEEMEKTISVTTDSSGTYAELNHNNLIGKNKIIVTGINTENATVSFTLQNEILYNIKQIGTSAKIFIETSNTNMIKISIKDQLGNEIAIKGDVAITVEKRGTVSSVYAVKDELTYRPMCTIEGITINETDGTRLIFCIPIDYSEVHF